LAAAVEAIAVEYRVNGRCKVCSSHLREQIDSMLIGETKLLDGKQPTFEDIVAWAADGGVEISTGGLSRHLNNHVLPAIGAALEVKATIEAISRATGKHLSLESAFANVFVHRTLKLLEGYDLEKIDPKAIPKLLDAAVKASALSVQIDKLERVISKESVKDVSDKIRKGAPGLSEEAIREIEESILGLRR
jgi:hypothetical protein